MDAFDDLFGGDTDGREARVDPVALIADALGQLEIPSVAEASLGRPRGACRTHGQRLLRAQGPVDITSCRHDDSKYACTRPADHPLDRPPSADGARAGGRTPPAEPQCSSGGALARKVGPKSIVVDDHHATVVIQVARSLATE